MPYPPVIYGFVAVPYVLGQVSSAAVIALLSASGESGKWTRAAVALTAFSLACMAALTAAFGTIGGIIGLAVWHIGLVSLYAKRAGAFYGFFPKRAPALTTFRALRPFLLVTPFFLVLAQLGAVLIVSRTPDGLRQVGLFYAAYQWKALIVFVPTVVAPAILAKLVATEDGKLQTAIFWRGAALSVGSVALACAPIYFGAAWIMRLYGQGFSGGVPIVHILVISSLVSALIFPLERLYIARHHERLWAFATGIGAAIYLAYVLAYRGDGGVAIAMGMLICLIVQALLGVVSVRLTYRIG
jgi:O-antigen/teichoic acid export membrane protein